MAIGLSEAVAALLGASATGLFGILDRRGERNRSRATLTAEVVAHAKFLAKLIREQDYQTYANKVADAAKLPDWDGGLLHVLPKGDYLHGTIASGTRAGELEAGTAAKLIEFVHRCTLFLDSTNPDVRYLENATIDDKRSHATETAANIEKLLTLGDELSQLS